MTATQNDSHSLLCCCDWQTDNTYNAAATEDNTTSLQHHHCCYGKICTTNNNNECGRGGYKDHFYPLTTLFVRTSELGANRMSHKLLQGGTYHDFLKVHQL